MFERFQQWLQEHGSKVWLAHDLSVLLQVVLILLAAWLSDFIVKRVLHRFILPIVKRSRTSWDDAIVRRGVLGKLAHLIPAWLIFTFLPPVLEPYPRLSALAANFVEAYIILMVTLALSSLIAAAQDIAREHEIARHAPTEIISQALRIVAWFIGFILILSALVDRSPLVFFSGLGAMTAVLMLIFKDSLLGLVAGLQIASNDLVSEGDWIEIPKYGADGTVTEVGLMTVKVQNWDKTISSVPTYALISDSFKNWRGMELSGGRRIKRSVSLDMTSVRFCDKEMRERFLKIQYLRDHIESKTKELAAWNKERAVDEGVLVNGRRLTNLGCFRAYLEAYLKHHPQIHAEGMTFIVRHLPPGPTGLPIEVYVFSKDQRWVQYEAIQADIFDHILAVIPQFDLRVFQEPTGSDFQRLSSRA
jgi:miniconductance mechanosensitive channel